MAIVFGGFIPEKDNSEHVIQNGDLLYSSNELIIKFKTNLNSEMNRLNLVSTMMNLFNDVSVKSIDPIFLEKQNSLLKDNVGLGRIYSVKYEGNIDPLLISKKLKNLEMIEYIEPRFIYKIDFSPNDPNISNQSYLNIIKAYDAWDDSKGDSSVVIGIIDTGVYWNHPDLNPNIWINTDEIPDNNVDDDNNGYVDDYRGWDFGGLNGTPDNNPKEDAAYHGTHVAGIASASTNNGIGVAGVGFKCKIMAVKTTRDDKKDPSSGNPYIWYGYEGIVYAADNDAQIINCSWGGSGFSQFGQDIINYATNKGSLVVAAAGNSNSSSDHFPSGYQNVLSVAATQLNDIKSTYSNYGYSVDVCAPGDNIYNTWSNNTYAYLSGTSMASPVVAGIAGLVKAKYPNYSLIQVGEKIRISTDDIYSINPAHQYMLGKGRVNALKSLQNDFNKSVRMLTYSLNDQAPNGNGNGILEPNEEALIVVYFKNILENTSNLVINLVSLTNGITVISGSFSAGAKTMGENFSNTSTPYRIKAASTITSDLNVRLILNYSDGTYTDWQVINFTANPSYVISNNNNISLTIGSRGNLAFNDYPTNTKGEGFKYKTSNNLLFEGALITGISSTKISDVARNNTGNAQSSDFIMITPVKLSQPGTIADLQATSLFNDDGAGTNKLGIKVLLNSYSYADYLNEDYIILHYKFINNTSSTITNFHAGLFFDWDLITNSGDNDVAKWDSVNKFGYVYNQPVTVPYYIGAGLLSHSNYHFRAILNQGGDGGWGIYDGFSDSEKWESISVGLTKTQAGAGDVSFVVASGPHTINPNDTLSIAFSVFAGDDLSSLQTHFNSSKQKWNQIITAVDENSSSPILSYQLYQNYPNPFNPSTKIKFSIKETGFAKISLYDVLGKKMTELINAEIKPGEYEITVDAEKLNLPAGIYFYELSVNNFKSIRKMVYLK